MQCAHHAALPLLLASVPMCIALSKLGGCSALQEELEALKEENEAEEELFDQVGGCTTVSPEAAVAPGRHPSLQRIVSLSPWLQE